MSDKTPTVNHAMISASMDQTTSRPYLVFTIGGKRFGARLGVIREISEDIPIKPIPNGSQMFIGFGNLRGEVIGVVDIAQRLGVSRERGAKSVMIVCESEGGMIAVQADGVTGVLSLTPETMMVQDSSPADDSGLLLEGLAQSDHGVVTLLDFEKGLKALRFPEKVRSSEYPGAG